MHRSLLLPAVITLLAAACGGHVALGGSADGGTSSSSSSSSSSGGPGAPSAGTTEAVPNPPAGTLAQAGKVDLLLVVDNSTSMGDKQELLRKAVPELVGRLVAPNCVDEHGITLGPSTAGACTQGKLEFAPVRDLHVGVISTSLGGRGGDVCDGTDPVGAGATRHDDDHAHLLTRGSAPGEAAEHEVADAAAGFLAYPAGVATVGKLVSDVSELIAGVHEYGCGIEAQLESWYRFLIQPDPYAALVPDPKDGRRRVFDGVDGALLKQRHDFLRPDSLVAVVLLTDEDDSTPDPLSVGGQGWAYNAKRFPGSIGGGAARSTSACGSPSTIELQACTSCGFPGHAQDPSCLLAGDPDPSGGNRPQLGYYRAQEDTLNTRWVRMKERYGVDPQYPIGRYFNGLTGATVPSRAGELYDGVGPDGQKNLTYNPTNDCTNPLFAATLPSSASDELCHLPAGPRAGNLVVFATITGVPEGLLARGLDAAAWTRIVGKDQRHHDLAGIDPHMLQSQAPRAGLPPPASPDNADPSHGREWDTGLVDLQYACTFPLTTPKDCRDPRFAGACDCALGTPPLPPLCDATTPTTQIRGKAYPGIRQLELARELGQRGVVASICPSATDTADGYKSALRALGDRMVPSLVPALQ